MMTGGGVVLALSGGGAPEQRVCWQRLRPGSGRLRVDVASAGPTCLLQVTDNDQHVTTKPHTD